MKVSVIVPVYNVERYLRRCLDSCVKQTLDEVEILVIDDGSPDQSWSIIEEYEQRYPMIKGYRKPNGGLSDTRNFGLNLAVGEYVFFLDSDDFILEDTLLSLYQKAKEEDSDLVCCDMNYFWEDGREQVVFSHIDHWIHEKADLKKSMTYIHPAACNKLYRKSLFDKVRFTKGILFEDMELLHRMYPYLSSISFVAKPFYQYMQRDGAITSHQDERLFHYPKNLERIVQEYQKNGFFDEYYNELEYCVIRYLYATFLKRVAQSKNKELYQKAVQTSKTLIQTYFPHPRKNPYFYHNGIKGLYLGWFNPLFAQLVYWQKGRKS